MISPFLFAEYRTNPVLEALAAKRYGDRDQFAEGAIVRRPDRSLFVQGDLSTYRKPAMPQRVTPIGWNPSAGPNEKAVGLASAFKGHPARHEAAPEAGTGQTRYTVNDRMVASSHGQPGYRDDVVHYDPLPDRTVYHERYIERVFVGPGGQEAVFRRLRHSTQMPGNPYVRTAKGV